MEFLLQRKARTGIGLGGRHSCEQVLKAGKARVTIGYYLIKAYYVFRPCRCFHMHYLLLLTLPQLFHETFTEQLLAKVLLSVFYTDHPICPHNNGMLNTFYPCFLDIEIGINNLLKSLTPGHTESKWHSWDYDPGSLNLEFQSLAHDFI